MLVQIVSDLHLETFPSYGAYQHRLSDADHLALLGDIGHVGNPDFERLVRKLLDHYTVIFYLLGNHDSKGFSMDAAKQHIRAFESRMAIHTRERTIGRFVFLDQTRCDLDAKVTVLGCTLYSQVPDEHSAEVGLKMIEFTETIDWTVPTHNAAHHADLAWLNSQVAQIQRDEPQRSVVIFTHHCPTLDARARDPRHGAKDPMTCAFSTDLSNELCWTSPAVRLWAWGHTHWNCNFTVERSNGAAALTCFANQQGYYRGPKASFDPTVAVEIPEGQVYRQTEEGDDTPEKVDQAAAPRRRAGENAVNESAAQGHRSFRWAKRLFRR